MYRRKAAGVSGFFIVQKWQFSGSLTVLVGQLKRVSDLSVLFMYV
jgi:hypothetical protein